MMINIPVSRVQATGADVITARFPTAADWWDPNNEGLCIWAAYQPKGAASFAASLLDLSGNGNNAGDPGGANTPAWDAVNGWRFNAAHYLTTAAQPIQNQTWSMLIQATNVNSGAVNRATAGCKFGGRDFRLAFDYSTPANRVLYSSNGSRLTNPLLANGNLCIAGRQGYRNGIADGAAIPVQANVHATTLLIGCESNGGVPGAFFIGDIQAFALYDCVLSGPQVLAVANAMAAL